MKGITKLMLCLAGSLLVTGCGKNVDSNVSSSNAGKKSWAERIYPEYDSLYVNEEAPAGTEGYYDYWETKKVTYQFVNDKTGVENHGFANYFPTLLNLYEDGSVKGWERCILIPNRFDSRVGSTGTEAQDEYNSTYKLLELFYGYWTIDSSNKVTLNVQSSVDYDSDLENVKYTTYEFNAVPDATTKKFSFYFNCTEKGQAIKSYFTCDTSFEGTIQYTSYAKFALGQNVNYTPEEKKA